MKKKNLKSLKLNKNSISNFSPIEVIGKGPVSFNCNPHSRDCDPTIRYTTRPCVQMSIGICDHITRAEC